MADTRYIQTKCFEVISFEDINVLKKITLIEHTEQLWFANNGGPGQWINIDEEYKTKEGDPVRRLNDRFYEVRSKGEIITAIRME